MNTTAAQRLEAADPQDRLSSLRALLRTRFPTVRGRDQPEYGTLPTGLAAVDALLPGGVPRGALTLFSGAASSGKTSLALAVAAGWTRQGGVVGWVHQGAWSPPSAAHAGIDPGRLLSVRAGSGEQALRCTDFLLRWQAFPLVVLDWTGSGGRGAAWSRLGRLVSGSRSALVVLAQEPRPGDPVRFGASVHLTCARGDAAVRVHLDKSRYGGRVDAAVLRRKVMPGAPFPLLHDLPGLGQRWNEEL